MTIYIFGGYNVRNIDLGSLVLGAIFSGLIGFISAKNPGRLILFRVFSGIIEVFLGLLIILTHAKSNILIASIFILIGCELLGLSLGSQFKASSSSTTGSTRRPEIISPEPEPGPRPL